SIHSPARITPLKPMISAGFVLLVLLSMPTSGSTKIIVNAANASGRHGSSKRRNTHHVSSDMFAYQMGRYCDHMRYAQKMHHANSTLPMSQNMSVVMYASSPRLPRSR